MNKIEVVRMHRPDGSLVELRELLALIPGDDLLWTFTDFEGVGCQGPRGESILEFAELARVSRGGYVLSWSELVRFAGQLGQVINCLLVAARTPSSLERAVGDLDGADADVVIEAFDSTTWEIRAVDPELARRFSDFAAGM